MNKNDFPLEVFHPELQRTVLEMNKYYTHNLNASAGFILSGIAYSLNNSYEVELIKDRFIRPNLWTLFVSPSGAGKSPLFDAILKPIINKEQQLKQEYKLKSKQFSLYNDECKKGSLKEAEPSEKNQWLIENFGCANTPTEQQNLTLLIGKYSGEGMDRILSDGGNDGKAIIIKSDEILSTLKSFNQYNKGGGEEDFLKYYNYSSDNVSRADFTKDLYIREKNVSVLGCTQSDTIYEVITQQRISNGNAFRWLYIIEDELDYNKNAFTAMLQAKPDYEVMETYNKMIERFLIHYNTPVKRVKLVVTRECIEYAAKWLESIKKIEEIDRKILLNINAKMEDYLFKIAIALNRSRVYLDYNLTKNDVDNWSIEIQDMINAEKVINYFIQNSIKVLNKVLNPTDNIFKSDIEKEIYQNLPETFNRNNFVSEYMIKAKVSKRTAENRINDFQNKKIIGKLKMNEYYKILAA